MMLAPLSPDVEVKMALTFLLNVKGELDLEQVKIVTAIHAIDDVDIQYSIHRPAVANVFGTTYCALSPEDRARILPVEVQAYEQVPVELKFAKANEMHWSTAWSMRSTNPRARQQLTQH